MRHISIAHVCPWGGEREGPLMGIGIGKVKRSSSSVRHVGTPAEFPKGVDSLLTHLGDSNSGRGGLLL